MRISQDKRLLLLLFSFSSHPVFPLQLWAHNFFLLCLMCSLKKKENLTIEPSRQVFALHAVMLLAQVSQNDWLCTQEVVECCRVQLLICTNKMQALVSFFFSDYCTGLQWERVSGSAGKHKCRTVNGRL